MKKLATLGLSLSTLLLSASVVLADEIPINIPTPATLKVTDFGKLLSGAIGVILIFSALAAFIYLIWGGIAWITSGGDKSQTEAARNRIQAAILGLFIVFAAWALMLILEQFFGVSILRGIKLPTGF